MICADRNRYITPRRGVPTHPLSLPLVGVALSVQAISWVLEHSESRLGPRHVLISIANHAKANGTGAWPSVRTISHEAKLSEREVRYALRELEKSGELRTHQGKGPHGCNLYSLPRMGQSLQGQKMQGGKIEQVGGQNPTGRVSDFAPEPKSIEPSINRKMELRRRREELERKDFLRRYSH